MNKYITIFNSDIKNARRDPMLMLILIAPFFIIGIVRYGLPVLLNYYPVIGDYTIIFISLFSILCGILPGFIMSFILLDEKDLQLIPVIRITPASLSGFLITRMTFMAMVGFISSLCFISFNGIFTLDIINALLLAILCALNSPILILLTTGIARNKIEGLTLVKVSTVAIIIPAIILFIDSKWEYLLGVFPAYWVYAFIDTTQKILIFILGIIYLSGINYLCFRFALKKL